MNDLIYNKFRKIVYDQSGISLGTAKKALVAARVGKRMRALNMDDPSIYLKKVINDETGQEIVHLLDAISTNVTSFFREAEHFDFIKQHMEKWLAEGQTKFRIWSSASSTGEEPYTIAMTIEEALKGYSNIDVKILATDISTEALKKAINGEYDSNKLDTIPKNLRLKYFTKEKLGELTTYTVLPNLKKLISYNRLNLSKTPFPMNGPFDFVFCRNVMIYFDNTVRKNLLDEIYRLLKPGGFLMVGHAESLSGMISSFKTVKPSIYIKA